MSIARICTLPSSSKAKFRPAQTTTTGKPPRRTRPRELPKWTHNSHWPRYAAIVVYPTPLTAGVTSTVAMRAIALDPGKATGLAEWEDHLLGWSHSGGHKAWVLPYADALEYAERHTKYGYCQLVVCEDFVISARTLKTGSSDWRRGAELEFIGVVRWLCSKHGVELVLQLPSEAFGFSSDEKLKRIGWWTPGPDHSRSASKHLLRALALRRLIDPKDLLAE